MIMIMMIDIKLILTTWSLVGTLLSVYIHICWLTEGTVLVWWFPQNKSKSLEEQTSLVRLLYP